jgi:hypothetical protein
LIRFPDSDLLARLAGRLGLPVAVIVRDLARYVEILNLRDKGFFDPKHSVLGGGMAMRTYGSQRVTVYDADLATTTLTSRDHLQDLLAYEDRDIEITPSPLVPTADSGKVWKSDPVRFEPYALTLPLTDDDKTFKVDIATYGLLDEGQERELSDPYGLDLWEAGGAPSVLVMSLEEIAAEKTLGWCAHRLYKHYADLAFIGHQLTDQINPSKLRALTEAKLDNMKKIQPRLYEHLDTLDDLIHALEDPAPLPVAAAIQIKFLRNPYTTDEVRRYIRDDYVPLLRAGTTIA